MLLLDDDVVMAVGVFVVVAASIFAINAVVAVEAGINADVAIFLFLLFCRCRCWCF